MVDFAAMTKVVQDQKGSCFVPDQYFLSVLGRRYHHTTGKLTVQEIYFVMDFTYNKPSIQFLNGVTGYECFYVEDMMKCETDFIWLCAGTDGRYDSLKIETFEIQETLRNWGY